MPPEDEIVINQPVEKIENPDLVTNPELRKEIATKFITEVNKVGKENFPEGSPNPYIPITDKEIDSLVNDQKRIDFHLKCKELMSRATKQKDILSKYVAENNKLDPSERFDYSHCNTFLYAYINPDDTPEAKKQNDALFERLRKEGDAFILDQAMETARNFDPKNYFPKNDEHAYEICKNNFDSLNVLWALNRNLDKAGVTRMPKPWHDVYSNNIKLFESTSQVLTPIQVAASPVYLVMPIENINAKVTMMATGEIANGAYKEYTNKGINLGDSNEFTNILTQTNNLTEFKNICNNCSKLFDDKDCKIPKDIYKYKAQVYDPETKSYTDLNNNDAIIALGEGKNVKFDKIDNMTLQSFENTSLKVAIDQANFDKTITAEQKQNKKDAKAELLNVDKYKNYLKSLENTHTIFSGTFLSTDSKAFVNMENALKEYINSVESTLDKHKDEKNPTAKIKTEEFKKLADNLALVEETAEKYFNEKSNEKRNDRKQTRFDIAKSIFENTDARAVKSGILGMSEAEKSHRHAIFVAEAANEPVKGQQLSKQIQAPTLDKAKSGPQMGGGKK